MGSYHESSMLIESLGSDGNPKDGANLQIFIRQDFVRIRVMKSNG